MSDAGRAENRLPKIYDIPLSEIDDFPDHPFQVRLDDDMDALVQSVKERGNAVFIGYDPQGKMRYGNVRGTMGDYKGDLSGSDKHYSFAILGESDTVHLFESAIDLLSFATLELLEGRDWRQNHLLSLAGVYKTKRTDVVPIALEQYLKDHPGVKTLRLHLDNDEIGRGAAAGIISGLNGRYQVFDEPPRYGKDVNDRLKMKIGMMKKDDLSR